jgi:nucleotide-binding universal stress UspA family protein
VYPGSDTGNEAVVTTRRILVAIDDSEATRDVARFVNEFFDRASGEIIAVNVAPSPVPWVPGEIGYGGMYAWPAVSAYPPETVDETRDGAIAASEETIDEAGVAVDETLVEFGDPATSILAAADERDVDLIVIGSHRKGFLKRLVSGSVSDQLVREAHRPVLVVHARDTEVVTGVRETSEAADVGGR